MDLRLRVKPWECKRLVCIGVGEAPPSQSLSPLGGGQVGGLNDYIPFSLVQRSWYIVVLIMRAINTPTIMIENVLKDNRNRRRGRAPIPMLTPTVI